MKQEQDENNFEVENSDDLSVSLGEDTNGDTPSKEPQPKDEDEGTKDPDLGEDQATKVESKTREEEQKPKKKSRTQRRIERVTKENAELREKLAEQEPEEKELDPDDFGSTDDYYEALEEQKSKAKEPKENAPDRVNQGLMQDALEDGKEDYDDFEDLIRATDLALTKDILDDVLESEVASDILYHLANNKDETRKIAGMTPRARQKALVKIELSLEEKPRGTVKKRKISKAPEPITPVDGNSSKPISLDDDGLSFGEYEKELNRQQSSNKSNGWA